MNEGGGMLVGGGGSLGGGGRDIIGGFVLSTTVSIVPVEATRERLGMSSATDDTTDSIDCLLSDATVRERESPFDSLKRFASGPGAGIGTARGIGPVGIVDEDPEGSTVAVAGGVGGGMNWNCWFDDPTR